MPKIPTQDREKLVSELRGVINRFSIENLSDTPDYILAEMLVSQLEFHSETVRQRDEWFGFKPWERLQELPVVTHGSPGRDTEDAFAP